MSVSPGRSGVFPPRRARRFMRSSGMTLSIGSTAPDFTAQTTQGEIRFHDWIGDSWCVLFSPPKDFTPVCTTELGYLARIQPEFDKRNCKLIGRSDKTRVGKESDKKG